MESHSERPEITAFLELEHFVRGIGEELAAFRRRALLAEAKLKEIEDREAAAGGMEGGNTVELSAEVTDLRERLEGATNRTQQMLDRVRFLRQQQIRGE